MTTAQTEARAIDALAEEMRTAMSCGICGHSRIDCECTHDEHRAFEAGIATLTQENAELRQALATARREALEEAAKAHKVLRDLDPENAIDDTLLRDIHARLQTHGEKYPDRMVSVLHRNVVLYTIQSALRALPLDIGGGDAG